MIEAVIFDFDGTLVNTLPLLYRVFHTIFWEFNHENLTQEQIAQRFGPPEEVLLKKYLSPTVWDQAMDRFFRLYEEGHGEDVQPTPDVLHMLSAVRDQGFSMALVSNKGRKAMEISLQRTGLSQWFPIIITGDDVTHTKPHPEGLETAMKNLGVSARRAIYVGDSGSDIEAARNANMRFAVQAHWMTTTGGARLGSPDFCATNPNQLIPWIKMQASKEGNSAG